MEELLKKVMQYSIIDKDRGVLVDAECLERGEGAGRIFIR